MGLKRFRRCHRIGSLDSEASGPYIKPSRYRAGGAGGPCLCRDRRDHPPLLPRLPVPPEFKFKPLAPPHLPRLHRRQLPEPPKTHPGPRRRRRPNLQPISNFFFEGVFAFLRGVLEKTGGKMWLFGGEFVVESWCFVVNWLVLFQSRKFSMDSGFIFE
jgi:hypothetical protein